MEQKAVADLLRQLKDPQPQREQLEELIKNRTAAGDPAWLNLFASAAARLEVVPKATAAIADVNFPALRLSIQELQSRYPRQYRNGPAYLGQIDALERQSEAFQQALKDKNDRGAAEYIRAASTCSARR